MKKVVFPRYFERGNSIKASITCSDDPKYPYLLTIHLCRLAVKRTSQHKTYFSAIETLKSYCGKKIREVSRNEALA